MDDNKNSFLNGMSVALSFIILSVILFFIPNYYGTTIATRIVCVAFGLIGIFGLLNEISKFYKINLTDIVGGFFCLLLWVILYIFLGKFMVF